MTSDAGRPSATSAAAEVPFPDPMGRPRGERPVVVVGGGFAGLACAKTLGAAGVETVLVDRHNYHLFVPLLYQVATAALSPADIAQPIRRLLRRYSSVRVELGSVEGVDTSAHEVLLQDGRRLPYRFLVLATGSVCHYFGHDDWAPHAPCPRDLPDATAIRAAVLGALERAETSPDPALRQSLMTFVVVGGGPTGVEMAGALAELVHHSLRRDFRRIDTREARIILVEAGARLLAAFPEPLARYAAARLAKLGVEVRLGAAVKTIDAEGVELQNGSIASATVIWGAGTRAASAVEWLDGVAAARGGRISVDRDLAVRGFDKRIFAIGDLAHLDGEDGRPLPALAQVAKQQGQFLGKGLAGALRGTPVPDFRFRNRGNAAIIGRNAAIFDFGGGRQLKGRLAWLLWAFVHIYLLAGFERRLLVATQWLSRYLTWQRGARLMTQADGVRPLGSDQRSGPA
ncbi:NAD(P)/FAD-dependent oxidoreductase [Bosea sp. (in: a-proteobacteria)]|uniref:NAD(P)/FAD-dependent oxidoreductase n=1 Tax=Bosea sp. (in: a-proteobacteria) TaxID=1871050 RepID=UPI0025C5C0B0|nr:NAD(P)/FAD-dependent oxidoreductase [Bosea sp. (in: a-proteobacteria)]